MLLSIVFIEKHYTELRKEDWRGMIADVVQKADPNDIFISNYAFYCNYYFKVYGSKIKAIDATQLDLSSQTPDHVWWLEAFTISETPSKTQQLLNEKGYIKESSRDLLNAKTTIYTLQQKPKD